MRMPNGYGSVIRLTGKRRRPYAVRITTECMKADEKHYIQKYRYLNYFRTYKEARAYLKKYNSQLPVVPPASSPCSPTFEDVYHMWLDFKKSLRKQPVSSTFRNYDIAFRQMSVLHGHKFKNIRLKELQDTISQYRDKSKSTNRMIMTVLHGMYEYGMKYEIVDKDYSQLVTVEWTDPTENIHVPFSREEINILWKHQNMKNVYIILILIYSGMRASEFLTLETKNIHLDECYLQGGIKTNAGKNRIIPIHENLMHFFKLYYNKENKYFYPNPDGNAYYFEAFNNTCWKNLMLSLNMKHRPHDARHTCATLLEAAGVNDFHRKLILGHSVNDLTNRVYTHVPIETLVSDINKIQ